MNVPVAYGKEGLDITVPGRNVVKILRMADKTVVADPMNATRAMLDDPIGSRPLAELAKGGKTACIVVSDITRPVPNTVIVPPILDVLGEAGMAPDDITILIATGIHRPNVGDELTVLLGGDIPKKYRVVNHLPRDLATHRYLGETPIYKAPIHLDSRFLDADLKIVTGLIEPHLMAGYSGGRKGVVPGIAAFETLKVLHGYRCMACANNTEGVIEKNTFHEESLYVARKAGTDFIVNVTLNERREITGIFAGDLDEAHLAGVEFMSGQCTSLVDEPVDAVITSGAGYPLDLTFYQTVKGMTAARQIVRPGGVIMIASRIAEGIGSPEFTKLIMETESVDEFLKRIEDPENLVLDQWQFQKFCQVLADREVWLYSEGLDHDTQSRLFVTPLDSIEDGVARVLERFGPDARIAVIPEGPYVYAGVERH